MLVSQVWCLLQFASSDLCLYAFALSSDRLLFLHSSSFHPPPALRLWLPSSSHCRAGKSGSSGVLRYSSVHFKARVLRGPSAADMHRFSLSARDLWLSAPRVHSKRTEPCRHNNRPLPGREEADITAPERSDSDVLLCCESLNVSCVNVSDSSSSFVLFINLL